jgi:hypothetical protein
MKTNPLLNKAPRYDVLGEWKYSFHAFLTSTLDGGEWLASRHHLLYPRDKNTPTTRWIEVWVGPGPSRELNPGRPVHIIVAILTELPQVIRLASCSVRIIWVWQKMINEGLSYWNDVAETWWDELLCTQQS